MTFSTFTRISDSVALQVGPGAGLGNAGKSHIMSYEGLEGYTFARAYAGGSEGQAVPIGTAFAQKQFSINILVADTSGFEQKQLLAYFRNQGWFTVVDTERGIPKATFTVIDVAATFYQGTDWITITAMLQKGYLGETYYNNFQSYNLTSGVAGSQSLSRTVTGRASIAVSLETASPVAYPAFTLSIAGTVTGVTNTIQGTLASAILYSKFFLDSARGWTTMNGLPNTGSGSTSFIPQPLKDGVLSSSSVSFTVPAGASISLVITYTAPPANATLRVWELGL